MNGKSGKSYDRKICHYGDQCENNDSCYIPNQSLVCFNIKSTGVTSSGDDYEKLFLYNANFDNATPLNTLTDGEGKMGCKNAKENDIFIIEYHFNDGVSF